MRQTTQGEASGHRWQSLGNQALSASALAWRLTVVFALYFVAGKLGLAVPFTSSNVSPVWPAAGVAVAAVLIWGVRVAPAIALAAFLVNFFSPIPASAAAGIGLGNAFSAIAAGYLLAATDFQTPLPRLKDVLRFLLLAVGLATTVAAFVGVTALTLAHTKAWAGYGSAWRIWWLGDAMGVLVITPLLLTGRQLLRGCRGWRVVEFGLLCGMVITTSSAIFGPWVGVRDDVLALVVFPFVVWAAIRFRVAGAAIVSLLIAMVALWGTAKGFGPFVNHSPLHNAVLLQIFIAVTAFTGLILAAVINEKEHIGKAFENSEKLLGEIETINQSLEVRVRERTRELEDKTAQLANQAKLLDLANDAIFVRNADGGIGYWNEGAERLYGWRADEAIGKSTQELLQTELPPEVTAMTDRWEGELQQRRRDGSQITVASRWTTLRNDRGQAVGWLEINTDVTGRKQAEDAARALSGRILTLQDEERRRIARELHDSLGQYLAALKMNLDRVSAGRSNSEELIRESLEMLDKCLTETRTISHLLHPPLLDEAGFGSAARWYTDGFAQRSGIKVHMDLPAELPRMEKDIEIALFRALQEALTNVHRHARSSSVNISVTLHAGKVQLAITDDGPGIAPKRLKRLLEGTADTGVGIAGMRERMRELDGSLKIHSDRTGTTVIVSIPQRRKAASASEEGAPRRGISAAG